MDRMIYLAMSGAKALEERQHALANNLANAGTDGFRADLMAFRAVPVRDEKSATTRVFGLEATAGIDTSTGPLRQTGNPLDMAIHGPGFFAVTAPDGGEAYTRGGAFVVGADGNLQTHGGLQVVGDAGPIAIPAGADITVGSDGTVSARTGNEQPVQIGRLKLVDPPAADLRKDGNGLVRTLDGLPAPLAENVRVANGALEGSNVNVVESMVGMIAVSRQFEMQMKLIQNAEGNEARALQLLSSSG